MQDLTFIFAHHKFIVSLLLFQVLVNSSNNRLCTDLSPKLMLLTRGLSSPPESSEDVKQLTPILRCGDATSTQPWAKLFISDHNTATQLSN